MPRIDAIRNLPVPTGPSGGYSSAYRGSPRSLFLSQLIAERYQSSHGARPAPSGEVLRVYDESGKLRIARLPPGYRMSISA